MVEALPSPAQATYWLISGQTLFIILNLLGLACFAYIVTRRVTPLVRGERDFRFDRPFLRLGKSLAILAGTVEASALPDRRNNSRPYFYGLHSAGDARLLSAHPWHVREFCAAGFLRGNRSRLRGHRRLCRDHCLPLYDRRCRAPHCVPARALRGSPKVRQRATRPTPSSCFR